MSLPGETIGSGAAPRCEDCGNMPRLDVYLSGAGYYIGTYCDCGPYTRESGYYRSRELAQTSTAAPTADEAPPPNVPEGIHVRDTTKARV